MHRFSLTPGTWTVVKLAPDAPIPAWATSATDFFSVTRTTEELSIICPLGAVPDVTASELRWSLFKIEGPFSFAAVGVLASFGAPLAAAGISILAVSTYDTDYLLVRSADEAAARQTLILAGHTFVTPSSDPVRP